MKKMYLVACFVGLMSSLTAQTTLDELNSQKASLAAQVAGLQSQISAIDAQIAKDFPKYGWTLGAQGTIGVNLSNFSNWLTVALPESRNTTILGSFNFMANDVQEKFFWKNNLNVNLGWQKLVRNTNNPTPEESEFTQTADIFNLTSLFGYRLNSKWALSGLGAYRTNLLNNFNNPGYLDLGIGATWTPIANLVAVFHPLNYNIVFADNNNIFESSLGTKMEANYIGDVAGKVKWRSNLSAFFSYRNLNDLSNYTWTNGFSFTAFKGIGVGFEYALRINKQETLAAGATKDLQQYMILGLTYSL